MFKASSKQTPCPICGRTSVGCRTKDELLLCRIGNSCSPLTKHPNLKAGDVVAGDWACVKINEEAECASFKIHQEREPRTITQTRRWQYGYLDGRDGTATKTRNDYNWGEKSTKWTKGVKPAELAPLYYDELPAAGSGELIFLVEGEACCDALRDLGLTATSVPSGSSSWKTGVPNLDKFSGNRLVLCPDRDRVGVELMKRVAEAYPEAKWLLAQPANAGAWSDPEDGYDVADWVQDGATAETLLGAVTDQAPALPVVPWWEVLGDHHNEDGKETSLPPAALDELLEVKFGGKLRLNQLTQCVEWEGQPLSGSSADYAYRKFSRAGIKITKLNAIDAILQEAERCSYHPVRDYLDRLDGLELLDDKHWLMVADFLLGGSYSPEHNSLFRKWLISAVARAYQPGCKFEFMIVLAGLGHTGKTEMFRALASPAWFGEGFEFDDSEQNTLMKLHKKWISEMGEVDGTTSTKQATKLKNFITRKTDDFRRPWGRVTESVDRSCVLCATTNKTDGFLVDVTGNRRFVIFEIESIPLERVIELRDRIWATARRDYLAGEDWDMDSNEQKVSEDANQGWIKGDPWQEKIGKWLDETGVKLVVEKNGLGVDFILEFAIGIEVKHQDSRAKNRAATVLKACGWRNKTVTKRRVSRWFPN